MNKTLLTFMLLNIGFISFALSILIPILILFKNNNLKSFSILLFLFSTISFSYLIYSHINDSFFLLNVFNNSHSAKPLMYKIAGVWGNYEGSLLMWVWMIGLYNLFLSFSEENIHNIIALKIHYIIYIIFALFIAFAANPFEMLDMNPGEGLGFNPLLQDIGLAIHPPLLYLGYTGTSVVFSLSFATLLIRNSNDNIFSLIRSYATISWSLLSWGIGLGAWWAYRELGWSGFWAWDPVENISLLPWFVLTALIHSIRIAINHKKFQSFTLFLGLLTFIIVIVGTFLVRSGLLESIHSFAFNNEQNIYMMIILSFILISSFSLFAINKKYFSNSNLNFPILSRGSALTANSYLMLSACVILLIGILSPVFVQHIYNQKISIEIEYYNKIFSVFALLLIFLMSFCSDLKWNRNVVQNIITQNAIPFLLSLLLFFHYLSQINLSHLINLILLSTSSLLISSMIILLLTKRNLNPQFYGMIISHLGLGLTLFSISYMSLFDSEKDLYMKLHQKTHFSEYDLLLQNVEYAQRQNYTTTTAVIDLIQNNKLLYTLKPELRFYLAEQINTSDVDIYNHNLSDLYIVISDIIDDGFVLHIYHKSLITLLWLGCFFVGCGGLVSLIRKKNHD